MSLRSVVALTLVIGGFVVSARLVVAADGDVTRFVVAGDAWVDAATVPGDIHVFDGPGNDGQFNYRYALDPTELGLDPHRGIAIDQPLRAGRIGYPVLAWSASLGGRPGLLPWAMVAVNVLALGALAAGAGVVARRVGRPPAAALLVVGWYGFLFSVARDYADPPAAALAVGALAVDPRRRPWWSGALLSAAVVTRESWIAVAGALALARMWAARTDPGRRRPEREDVAWLLPAAAFVGWQLVAGSQVGQVPVLGGEGNRSWPLVGVFEAVGRWVDEVLTRPDGLTEAAMAGLAAVQFAALLYLVWEGAAAVRTSRVGPGVTGAWVALVALSTLLSANVWDALADFRNLSELAVLGVLMVIGSPRPLTRVSLVMAATWLATVIPRIARI